MKREIPLIGLVLVLALLLIIPIFLPIGTHAFVCNISTVLSNVGACYVFIKPCVHQGVFITEKGVVGSLQVAIATQGCNGRCTVCLFVSGYIFVSGNLASHYIKPLSYTGYCFYLTGFGHVAFYCLSTPPKSLYYLGNPCDCFIISCFHQCPHFLLYEPGEVMPNFVGFRVPLDDIFYYILCPSLFCGSVITKTSRSSVVFCFHGRPIYGECCAYLQRVWGKNWWGGYAIWPYRCFPWCWKPVTATSLTYTVCFSSHEYTGSFCLIGTFLSFLPTQTMSCSFILPPRFHCLWRGPITCLFCYAPRATLALRTVTCRVWICYIGWWYSFVARYPVTHTYIYIIYGGVIINYLPYGTEYMIFMRLSYFNY